MKALTLSYPGLFLEPSLSQIRTHLVSTQAPPVSVTREAVAANSEDEAVIGAVLGGDDGAFRYLVERYQSHVARTVTGMLGKTQEVDDCVQEVFVKLYGSLDKYRGEAKIKTYVTRIAVNRSLDILRKRKRSFFVPWEAGEVEEVESASLGPEDNLFLADRRDQIRRALDRLTPKHRVVVVLRLIDGMSASETADVLGVPYGTVLSRFKRALASLKHALEKEGYENE